MIQSQLMVRSRITCHPMEILKMEIVMGRSQLFQVPKRLRNLKHNHPVITKIQIDSSFLTMALISNSSLNILKKVRNPNPVYAPLFSKSNLLPFSEDAEPFDALDEERDVKVLDVTEANYDSAATSVAELRSYHNMEADIKAIKIKSEHGKSLNSDDNNINENGSGSSGSGDPSRSKRRAVSLPSSSGSSTSKRGRGRPPKSGRIPVEKEDKRQSSDEDSDFKLESGEENAAEFSSSSSSDDNDPDWKGSHKLQSSSYQHHPQNKIGSMGGGPYRSRRGRPPNSLKNGRIPPNLVPLLPKAPTSLPGKFHPNGPIVLNLTSSPTCTMIPLPVNRFEVPYHRQKGRPRKTNPPQHLLHTTKTNPLQQNLPHNPIAQLPKVKTYRNEMSPITTKLNVILK